MNRRLENKVALVTGASRGIGQAIAERLAGDGAKVVLVSRKQEGLEAVAEGIVKAGGEAYPLATHLGESERFGELVAAVKEKYGRLDVLVNNAATNPVFGPAFMVDEGAFDKIFQVNVRGPFFLSKAFLPLFQEQGGGVVVNIASTAAISPMPGLGVYSMSKAAVENMGKMLATEWAPFNVRVNTVCPGLVKTRFSKALWDSEEILNIAMERQRSNGWPSRTTSSAPSRFWHPTTPLLSPDKPLLWTADRSFEPLGGVADIAARAAILRFELVDRAFRRHIGQWTPGAHDLYGRFADVLTTRCIERVRAAKRAEDSLPARLEEFLIDQYIIAQTLELRTQWARAQNPVDLFTRLVEAPDRSGRIAVYREEARVNEETRPLAEQIIAASEHAERRIGLDHDPPPDTVAECRRFLNETDLDLQALLRVLTGERAPGLTRADLPPLLVGSLNTTDVGMVLRRVAREVGLSREASRVRTHPGARGSGESACYALIPGRDVRIVVSRYATAGEVLHEVGHALLETWYDAPWPATRRRHEAAAFRCQGTADDPASRAVTLLSLRKIAASIVYRAERTGCDEHDRALFRRGLTRALGVGVTDDEASAFRHDEIGRRAAVDYWNGAREAFAVSPHAEMAIDDFGRERPDMTRKCDDWKYQ
ncbi:MAG: glucose 1-dehydrogenase [Deltaproteobacteria bacterium]|nr:glucose 1-dehydrogenase [Deltaproteobacteria bacterium]